MLRQKMSSAQFQRIRYFSKETKLSLPARGGGDLGIEYDCNSCTPLSYEESACVGESGDIRSCAMPIVEVRIKTERNFKPNKLAL